MNSKIENYLKIIYKLSPMIGKEKRSHISDYFSYKTNKIQLIFENISNPYNAVRKNLCVINLN